MDSLGVLDVLTLFGVSETGSQGFRGICAKSVGGTSSGDDKGADWHSLDAGEVGRKGGPMDGFGCDPERRAIVLSISRIGLGTLHSIFLSRDMVGRHRYKGPNMRHRL